MQIFVLIYCSYLISYFAVAIVIDPIQQTWVGDLFVGSLVFLPHGIRVLATWLYREMAIIPLAAGQFTLWVMVWKMDLPISHIAAGSLISGACVYIVMQSLLYSKIIADNKGFESLNWRSIMFIAAISSFINGVGNLLLIGGTVDLDAELQQLVAWIIGDTLGAFAILIVAMFCFRYIRLSSRRQKPQTLNSPEEHKSGRS